MSALTTPIEERELTAVTFFEEALPSLFFERGAAASAVKGRLCVVVQGVGAWVVRFGARPCVEAGLDLSADCVACFSEGTFDDLLDGILPDPECMEPALLGDPSLLEKLGRLMILPSRGGLAARLACVK